MKRLTVFVNCSISIILGLMIYIFLGNQKIIFLDIVYSIFQFKIEGEGVSNILSKNTAKYISCYGADFLWAYSLSFGHFYFFEESLISINKILSIGIVPLIIAITFEFLQKFQFVGGVFDVGDIFVYSLGFLMAVFVCKIIERKNEV